METHDSEDSERDLMSERAAEEFKLNDKQGRLMEYIAANLKIEDFRHALSEEMWLREVLKLAQSDDPYVKLNALRMWGNHMNHLGKKGKGAEMPKEVEFE